MNRPAVGVEKVGDGTTVRMPAITAQLARACAEEHYVEPINLWPICRDERCLRVDVHEAHDTRMLASGAARRRRKRLYGWADDPCEVTAYEPRVSVAIDEAVVRAVGATPKNFATLYNDVTNDYGEVHERRLYRRVAALTHVGQIVCVDLGARILRDPGAIREQLEDLIYRCGTSWAA